MFAPFASARLAIKLTRPAQNPARPQKIAAAIMLNSVAFLRRYLLDAQFPMCAFTDF